MASKNDQIPEPKFPELGASQSHLEDDSEY